jgi:hypothetical protein
MPRRSKPLLECFLMRGPDECWPWLGKLTPDGYGVKFYRGKTCNAHVAVYKHFKGEYASYLVLDHKCRNRICVNPEHMEPVSNRENLLRGRGLAGTNARKTHCIRGHEFTTENTRTYRGTRACKACKKISNSRA